MPEHDPRSATSELQSAAHPLPPALLVLCLSLCLLPLAGCAIFALTYTGQIVDVRDGDRLTLHHDGRQELLRLFGVDCPELDQRFGREAKEFAERLALNKPVKVEAWGLDAQDGRMIALVTLPDGRSLSNEMVREGLAWWDPRYPDEPELEKLQAEARSARGGLWADPNPVPPWEFRPRWKR